MFYRAFSGPTLLGVDIQSMAIRCIEIQKNWRGFHVVSIGSLPLNEVTQQGRIVKWDVVQQALLSLVTQHQWQHTFCALHLPATVVIEQQIELPQGLSVQAIESEIDRVLQALPGMAKNRCVDYSIRPHENKGYSRIQMAVTEKNYLSQLCQMVVACGLNVKIVDVDIYAIFRAMLGAAYLSSQSSEVQMMVHVRETELIMMAANCHDIFFHTRVICRAEERVHQLQYQLHHIKSTFTQLHLKGLVVSGDLDVSLLRHHFPMLAIHSSDLFSTVTYATSEIESMIKQSESDYVIAFGLAMREIPK